jgi:hypothetical protein
LIETGKNAQEMYGKAILVARVIAFVPNLSLVNAKYVKV